MALNEYAQIPPAATTAGAPIDAFLLRTLRENSAFAEKRLKAALASPLAAHASVFPTPGTANVTIGAPINDVKRSYMYNAKTIHLTSDLVTMPGVPLVWFASEEIHLSAHIDATGKGALAGKKGNFGGAGGGMVGTAADDCELPLSGVVTAAGGAAGTNPGAALDENWATRLFLHLSGATGGGRGAGANATHGAGGGIVVLCAPSIKIDNGKHIFAKGQNGAAGSAPNGDGAGAGGGGLILLIAHEYPTAIPAANLNADGGTGGTSPGTGAAGGNGGNGRVLRYTFT